MGLFARAVIEDIEKDLAKNSRKAGAAWVDTVQRHPAVPVDTGALRRGIILVSSTTRVPVKIRIASTTTNSGFDYPAFLNENSAKHGGWWETVTNDTTVEAAMDELVKAL